MRLNPQFSLTLIIVFYLFSPSHVLTAESIQQLNQAGLESLAKKNYPAAIASFSQAIAQKPDNHVAHFNLAVAYHLYNNIEAATREFLQTIKLNPSFAPSYVNLGNIYYQQGNLSMARIILLKAQSIDPRDADVQKLLQKIGQETATESDFISAETEHFMIKYSSAISEESLNLYIDGLEEAYNDLGAKYNFLPNTSQLVILYTSSEFVSSTGSDHWVSGLFDGRLRFRVETTPVKERIESLIRHEYTHLIAYALSKGQCPIWLNEGLAVFNQDEDLQKHINLLQQTPDEKLVPLTRLNSHFKIKGQTAAKAHLLYAQAATVAKMIIDSYSYITVREMLTEFTRKPPHQVFVDVIGTDLVGLEKEWRIKILER